MGHACCHHGLAVSPKTQAHHLNCEPRDWLREPAVAPRAAQPGTRYVREGHPTEGPIISRLLQSFAKMRRVEVINLGLHLGCPARRPAS